MTKQWMVAIWKLQKSDRGRMVEDMKYYRIDYYSRRIGAYTYKIVKADTPEQAVKRSRIKNIEEVTLVSMEV